MHMLYLRHSSKTESTGRNEIRTGTDDKFQKSLNFSASKHIMEENGRKGQGDNKHPEK